MVHLFCFMPKKEDQLNFEIEIIYWPQITANHELKSLKLYKRLGLALPCCSEELTIS